MCCSLDDVDGLPAPDVIAAGIVENLQAALEAFQAVAEALATVKQLCAPLTRSPRPRRLRRSLTAPPLNHPGAATHVESCLFFNGRCDGKPVCNGFSLSLYATNEAEARRLFAALADGGTVPMPLDQTFGSPSLGMLADRFGVGWMVSAPGA